MNETISKLSISQQDQVRLLGALMIVIEDDRIKNDIRHACLKEIPRLGEVWGLTIEIQDESKLPA